MLEDPLIDGITADVVDASIQIHRDLGPGLFESVYEVLLMDELERRGHTVERQKELPLTYRGRTLDHAFRIDLLVDGRVLVEVKCSERPARVHARQLLTYLRIMRLPVGLVTNFGLDRMIDGINRVTTERFVP
jgi:iron complex transport system substrate-binding protein